MKTIMTKFRTIGALFIVLLISSCSVEKLADSFACNADGFFEEALVEKTFYQEALNAYAEEQSVENCQELKSSGNDYINAVENYIDCSQEGDEEIKRELKEAEKALADLTCS